MCFLSISASKLIFLAVLSTFTHVFIKLSCFAKETRDQTQVNERDARLIYHRGV